MSKSVVDNIIRSQVVEDYLDFFENKPEKKPKYIKRTRR